MRRAEVIIDVALLYAMLVIILTGFFLVMMQGCATKDKDLKVSNCSAFIKFNCNCEKDSSIFTDVIDSTTQGIEQ